MRDMKKFVTLGLVAVLGVALATGCKKKEETTTETTTTTESTQPAVVQETGTTATTTSTGTGTEMTGTTSTATTTTTESKSTTSTETKKQELFFHRSRRRAPERGPFYFESLVPGPESERMTKDHNPG